MAVGYELDEYTDVSSHEELPEGTIKGIEECVFSAFDGNITHEDALGHMQGDYIIAARSGRQVIGFCSASIISPSQKFGQPDLPNDDGVYFGGTAIRKEAQGKGIYGLMNERRLAFVVGNNAGFIFTQTQNPRVEEGITNSIQRIVDRKLILGFEVGKLARIGAYGRMLTEQKPVARSIAYDDLDYARGDSFLITWRLARQAQEAVDG